MYIREIHPSSQSEIVLVARRMRETLKEVLGPEKGEILYSIEWLIERVRQHIQGELEAKVFLAFNQQQQCIGHTIVRKEHTDPQEDFGLFSTIYIVPSFRRQAVAAQLIQKGEEWMKAKGLTRFATYTSASNTKLIMLFEKYQYTIVQRNHENNMIVLEKTLCSGQGLKPDLGKSTD